MIPIDQLALGGEGYRLLSLKGLIWCRSRLASFPWSLDPDSGKSLAAFASGVDGNLLIVQCRGVSALDNHCLTELKALLETRSPRINLAFLCTEALEDSLKRNLGPATLAFQNGDRVAVYSNAPTPPNSADIIPKLEATERCEEEARRRIIRESYRPYLDEDKRPEMRRLPSTPILASGEFNAQRILANPVWFNRIAIALEQLVGDSLADDQRAAPHPICLLALSLRGSPFAAAVQAISETRFELEIVDHMGPVHREWESYACDVDGPRKGTQYLYIGDFTVGGSELRVAKAKASANGGRLRGAVVIGAALSPDAYLHDVSVRALTRLRDAIPDLKYCFGEDCER